jgi:hypothetical protein
LLLAVIGLASFKLLVLVQSLVVLAVHLVATKLKRLLLSAVWAAEVTGS